MRHRSAHLREFYRMLKGLKGIFALAFLFSFALSLLPEGAEAQRLRDRRLFYRQYTLSAGVGFEYSREWGTSGRSTSFVQTYSAGFSGYIFDPRLVSFSVSSSLSKRETNNVTGGSTDAYSVRGLNINMHLLNAINPGRGIKLWNYVPRPIMLRYSYYEARDFNSLHYGASTYYTRPGYVRVFQDKKILSYSDKEEKYEPAFNQKNKNNNKNNNNNNKNRYRVKYQVNNQNGNGNGNGNGNSGNGNGNMNLNRNANNTGNNANWNKNINRNNRNNNNNNNLQNLQQQQQQQAERRRLVFKFPSVSFDIARDIYTDKKESERKWITTAGRLSADIQNPREKRRKGFYTSSYNFAYVLYETETHSRGISDRRRHDTMTANSQHSWTNVSLSNNFANEKLNDRSTLSLSSVLGYSNTFKIFRYTVSAGVSHVRSEGVSSTDYGVGLGVNTAVGIRRGLRFKPSPKLTSDTTFNLGVGASGGKSKGNPTSKDYDYSVTVVEKVTSTHFKRAKIYGEATVGYHKDDTAIPFKADISVDSVGFKNVGINGSYTFAKIYPIKQKGSSQAHLFRLSINFRVFRSVQANAGVSHSITEVQNGHSYKEKRSSANANAVWRVSRRGRIEFNARGDFAELSKAYSLSGTYTASIFLRSSISMSASNSWSEPSGGYARNLKISYNWSLRRVAFSADYTHTISGTKGSASPESKNNVLMFKVSRSFERSFRGR